MNASSHQQAEQLMEGLERWLGLGEGGKGKGCSTEQMPQQAAAVKWQLQV